MRDPRWGRNQVRDKAERVHNTLANVFQETYGEDPWLSGYLAQAYVTGLQGSKCACISAEHSCS